ncbi:MAG TPA: metallophosphoesterase [Acetobacteraceae bacterium]|nr:metallophosphoesterase [Acetobacteraceae bacterium]
MAAADDSALDALIPRIGRLHVRQRLGMEHDFEAHVFRRGTHFFHIENWHSMHGLVRGGLRSVGLLARARRNARRIVLRRHELALPHLPPEFDGFSMLQLTDLHIDAAPDYAEVLIEAIRRLDYDLCVLTGDYRARTFGPFDAVLAGLAALRPHLKNTPYAILGNHDTLRMVPAMEAMGYRLLLNEWTAIRRDGAAIYLAGIDDAHFYRLENFHRAADEIPARAVSILLSHTPEAYRHAAHAGFDLMLCGHTHGGQICLPNGVPVLTDASSPRRFARGAWHYHAMRGYTATGSGTSLVDVRLNCPPEVTLHTLKPLPPAADGRGA